MSKIYDKRWGRGVQERGQQPTSGERSEDAGTNQRWNEHDDRRARALAQPTNTHGGELAPRFARLMARVVDLALLLAICIPILYVAGYKIADYPLRQWIPAFGVDTDWYAAASTWAAFHIVYLTAYMSVNGFFLHRNGQTIGKLMLGLRMRDQPTRMVPTIGCSLFREAYWVIYAVPVIGPMIVLLSLISVCGEDQRTYHDFASQTDVVI